ncbi:MULTISPECIES: type II toxin-antitoxin system VapC family toxin [unclassified Paenibacillus]|uniref:type II toxin-antitoxin system VapC family toxin n=1 Tax=unclassified Paenibacillus TaxID=185978 RepID=UPI00363C7224
MNNHEQINLDQAVFVDQSALTSFMDPQASYYSKARSIFIDLDDLDRNLVTTNYVLFDTHQWLRNSYGFEHAQFFLDTMETATAQSKLTVISGRPEFENESKRLIMDCPDLQLSLSEAVTAVVMITYQIKRIFTFNPSYAFLPKLDSRIKVLPSLW